jgi:hypothetical protein
MALSFNPKMLAHDIAKGLSYLNQGNLKKIYGWRPKSDYQSSHGVTTGNPVKADPNE